MLNGIKTKAHPADLLENWKDGRIKLFVTQRLLLHRRDISPDLYRHGDYQPLEVTGEFAECALAFRRCFEGEEILVVVPRLCSRVGVPPLGEAWRDTAVSLPPGNQEHRGVSQNLFTGAKLDYSEGGSRLMLAKLLEHLPFAVLVR